MTSLVQHCRNLLPIKTLNQITGEKKLKVEEFLPIYSEAKKSKDYGTLEDFMECMKLYDKAENGTMLGAELNHILLSLGKLKTTSLLSA